MKTTITVEQEIDVATIRISVPVHHEEECIPNDFPMRNGDMWTALVDMDTGRIDGWPKGKSGDMYLKVCDGGCYTVYDRQGKQLAELQDYVPNEVVPGEYGDYIDLKINRGGVITNWPKEPDVSVFFRGQEE